MTRYAEQVRSDPGTKNAMAAQAKLFDEEGAMRCKAKFARPRRSGELKFLGGRCLAAAVRARGGRSRHYLTTGRQAGSDLLNLARAVSQKGWGDAAAPRNGALQQRSADGLEVVVPLAFGVWPLGKDGGMTLGIRMWLVCFDLLQQESSSPRGGRLAAEIDDGGHCSVLFCLVSSRLAIRLVRRSSSEEDPGVLVDGSRMTTATIYSVVSGC